MADIATALVSGGVGLVGALIGAFSAQLAARKTRESDRRKRCVDRVLAAITLLDKAYAEYVTTSASAPDDPKTLLPLQGSLRAYNQAVEMLHIPSLRAAATRYRDRLTEFYLMYGQPRDPLDADRKVPTLHELNDEHVALSEKLRGYERT
ncbi:hypothetical protein [Mycobacterium sp. NS-7484]|uniref:hypothetical protein n=1 Tax=Mycobacterium sp. NS-7484 TaxID=1834161 RepID=UPI00114EFAE5|nr:hypothetical protein [Mycobacterium sp. NS-7484]